MYFKKISMDLEEKRILENEFLNYMRNCGRAS